MPVFCSLCHVFEPLGSLITSFSELLCTCYSFSTEEISRYGYLNKVLFIELFTVAVIIVTATRFDDTLEEVM